MGIVVRLPLRHARTSAGSRAANAVNTSAVTQFAVAFSVASTADHHSAGMLSRCPHLVTAVTWAPTSAAMASREGHNSMMDLKEDSSLIGKAIGQTVLKRKAILSLDGELSLGHTVRMAESETEAEYKQEFMDRIRKARIARGLKQWEIAEALGMPQDKYKQYESRSLLPHYLLGRFCVICRVDEKWLVTGRGKMAVRASEPAAPEPERIAKPRRTRTKRAA